MRGFDGGPRCCDALELHTCNDMSYFDAVRGVLCFLQALYVHSHPLFIQAVDVWVFNTPSLHGIMLMREDWSKLELLANILEVSLLYSNLVIPLG